MSSLALLQSLKESILSQASVKAIYGEPIAAQGKTVIPVAKKCMATAQGPVLAAWAIPAHAAKVGEAVEA
jgi:uncharacterized spore protein YtfJ